MSQPPELRHLVAVPTGAPRLAAVDLEGCDVDRRSQTLRVAAPGHWTLLIFLGSSCDGCLPFWRLAGRPERCGLEPQDAVAIVTRGPARERPRALAALMGGADGSPQGSPPGSAPGSQPGGPPDLIMSDAAWTAYRVHGAPFFVLLDGVTVVTEGVAWSVEQLASDLARARRRPGGEAQRSPSARR
jgi:hypothetical protein